MLEFALQENLNLEFLNIKKNLENWKELIDKCKKNKYENIIEYLDK